MNNEKDYEVYQYTETNTEPPAEDMEKEQPVEEETVKNEIPKQETESQQSYRANVPPTYDYSKQMQTPPIKKKSNTWKKWVLCISMAIVFGIVASSIYQTSNFIISRFLHTEQTVDKTVGSTITKDDKKGQTNKGDSKQQLTDVSEVAQNVMPSVVSITNLSVQEVQNFFFGGSTVQQYESTGSGIIVGQNDTELLIVSNNHVVEASTSLTISFVDGKSVEGKIKGTDANIDLAIIAVPLTSIESETLDAIKIATLGDSDELAVGEPAIAIGNALGYGQSVTYGIISAVDREIEGYDAELIQTDAAINPGNSGGALLNQMGEVIGINTVKLSADAVEGMGYAIPISDVSDIINELMNRETRDKVDEDKRGTLGISGVDVDESVSQLYNMPQGVHISEIIKGGAAEKAGITKGSIITKLDGTSIKSMNDLKTQLEYYKAGEEVELTVKVPTVSGEYENKTYKVVLGEQSILNK